MCVCSGSHLTDNASSATSKLRLGAEAAETMHIIS